MGETGLALALTHLLVTAGTHRAATARADERRGDPLTTMPPAHQRPDRPDRAGELVARDMRQDDVRVMTLPAVPVAAAHAGGLDLHHRSVRRRLRLRDFDDTECATERLELDGSHHEPFGR